jgi:hypothetical protein
MGLASYQSLGCASNRFLAWWGSGGFAARGVASIVKSVDRAKLNAEKESLRLYGEPADVCRVCSGRREFDFDQLVKEF